MQHLLPFPRSRTKAAAAVRSVCEGVYVLQGRHDNGVGARALREAAGPSFLYLFGFLNHLLQASGCVRRDFP